MRLIELDPRWFTFAHPADGVDIRFGLTFLCPHCRTQRLGVEFDPPIDPAGLIAKFGIQFPQANRVWKREGDTFETLTLSPSIDASRAATIEFDGHWHGHITAGNVI
jgi:hypothetical protein